MGTVDVSRAENEHKVLKSLGDISTAIVGELKSLAGMLGSYAEAPENDPLSVRFGALQRAAAFCGYWGVSTYLGALNELCQVIERESSDVVGRTEYMERVRTLGAGIQTLGAYLQDVAKGVNASNGSMNDTFRVIARKCRPELLNLEIQDAKEIFFMPVPLSLEIEASWVPAISASHLVLVDALRGAIGAPSSLSALVPANPYRGLAGFFEGVASQPEFVGRAEIALLVDDELTRLLDLLSAGIPTVGPSPDSFLFSRLLYAAAHNTSPSELNQNFRNRYALLTPAVMAAVNGAVSMYGLAKELSKGIQKVQDAYQQANLMRSTSRLEQFASVIQKEAVKIGSEAYKQLAILFESEVQEIVRLGALDDQRAAIPTEPTGDGEGFVPSTEATDAWIRGAQVLCLLKEAVETWSSHDAQLSLLAVASRANFDGVIDVSRTMQIRTRDLSLVKVAAALNANIASLKTSIDTAMRQAHGRTLGIPDATKASELIAGRASPVFDQVIGIMTMLALPRAAAFALTVRDALREADRWVLPESRTELFELITRFGVFVARLRPGTLIDIQPEEAGETHFDGPGEDEREAVMLFHVVEGGVTDLATSGETIPVAPGDVSNVSGDAVSAFTAQTASDADLPECSDDGVSLDLRESESITEASDPEVGSSVAAQVDSPVSQLTLGAPVADLSPAEPAPVLVPKVEGESDLELQQEPLAGPVGVEESVVEAAPSEEVSRPLELSLDADHTLKTDELTLHSDEIEPQSNDASPLTSTEASLAAENATEIHSGDVPDLPESVESFDLFAPGVQMELRTVEQLKIDFLAAELGSVDKTDSLDGELAKVMFEETGRCLSAIFEGFEVISSAEVEEQEETLAAIKREIHTLKGACRTVGLLRAGSIFHSMEDELDLGAGDIVRFLATIESFKAAAERARGLLEAFQTDFTLRGSEPARDAQESPEVLRAEPAAPTVEIDHSESVEVVSRQQSVAEKSTVHPPLGAADDAWTMRPTSSPANGSTGARTNSVAGTRKASDETVRLPLSMVAQVGEASGSVLMSTRKLQDSIDRLSRIERSLDTNIRRMTSSMRELEILAAAGISASTSSASSAAGFDPLELDSYTSLQEVVRTLSETHQDVLADLALLQLELSTVRRDESDLSEISDGLQRDSSGLLLMPLSSQASRLKSVVQRAAADANKEVELEIERDCKAPAAAMDKLMPVFEHILRNSVAHGLEANRAAAGKPEVGLILISLAKTGLEAGGVVNISVRDDGAGINHERVLALALQRGLAKTGREYSQREIREFIFAPGFSTADKVTQLSGRGVGLDVVRDTVSRLGGVITLDTVEGKGTEFIITIPTDAATMAVLPVSANGFSVMLPISIIKEILPLGSGASSRVQVKDASVWVEGVEVEIVRLHDKVPMGQAAVPAPAGGRAAAMVGHLIVMREGEGTKAILVDSVRMQTRVVVTALGPFVKSIPGFIAGTVLEGGNVGLIVNPIRMTDVETFANTNSAAISKKRVSRVMIVDDSPSMRLVTSRLVRRMGYDVITCSDGLDALNAINSGSVVDAFLVDLEMPGMDGFELISQLRRKVDHHSKPIVVISSRTAEKHRNRAMTLGASEYLTKPYEESVLERLIDTLVARRM